MLDVERPLVVGGGRASQDAYARSQDWEFHRRKISRLYLDEHKTLRQVADIMRSEDGFLATEKMYKSRITKWGLRKNRRIPEVLEMLQLKRQREQAGKKSVFIVRGNVVDWEEVERYLKARPDVQAKVDPGQGVMEIGNAHHGIICRTPSPDPSTAFSVPSAIGGADEVRLPDEVFRLMRRVIDGATQAQSLRWAVHRDPRTHLQEFEATRRGKEAFVQCAQWYSRMRLAADMMQRPERLADATRLINVLLNQLRPFLTDTLFGSAVALPYMMYALVSLNPEVGLLVNDFVAQLVQITLGAHHPMSLAWARLRKLPPPQLLLTLSMVVRSEADFMGGPAGITSANARHLPRDYSVPPATWVTWLTVPGDDSDKKPGKLHDITFLRRSTGWGIFCAWHIQNGNWEAARKGLRTVASWIGAFGESKSAVARAMRAWYLFAMARLSRGTNEADEEKRYLMEGYDETVNLYGPRHPETITLLLHTVNFFERVNDTARVAIWKEVLEESWSGLLADEFSKSTC